MTDKTNIQQFDEISSLIFAKLYASFPIPLSIDCVELIEGSDIDEAGNASNSKRICTEALKWLDQEGFIVIGNTRNSKFYDVRLTAQGLDILNSIPESLEDIERNSPARRQCKAH